METVIGGLFKREDQADAASRALRREGFGDRELSLLARKPHNAPVHLDRIQAPVVGRSAIVGAVMLALAGGLLGLLLGVGVIPVPGVDAATYRDIPAFVLSAIAAGALAGCVTGAILGVASRLFTSKDKVAITSQGVKRGGLLLVVRPHNVQQLVAARRILEQNGAVDLQDLNDKWDPEVWSDFNQVPLAGQGTKDSPG